LSDLSDAFSPRWSRFDEFQQGMNIAFWTSRSQYFILVSSIKNDG